MTSYPILFPAEGTPGTTSLVLGDGGDGLPLLLWAGPRPADATGLAAGAAAAPGGVRLLAEHAYARYGRPGLRGHRLAGGGQDSDPGAGRDWSTRFATTAVTATDRTLTVEGADPAAGLELRAEAEALPGGALRLRQTVTNAGAGPYLLDGLDVVVPVPGTFTETLDFTGRHEGERSPQRRAVTDGTWLRENRHGKPGADATTLLVAGTPGFGFGSGEVLGLHVGWSGNDTVRVERLAGETTTIGGGEFLLPGEVVLAPGEAYTSPWVYVTAAADGLDGLAAQLHAWQRTLPAHPARSLVTLNVWEAVYFRHDLDQLRRLADLAAAVGVERYVLDDGWFHGRRHDRAGLGDWWVDPAVWPDGLGPLVEHVRGLGMEFGLWFEPEMVNPDSDLYRAHPEWILASGGRVPVLHRNQVVLDLTVPEARAYVFEKVAAVLAAYDIGYVKWDHNRELLEAGSHRRGGAPAVHEQTLAYYGLLDELRAAFPGVTWESCSAGGERIDLGVIERVQRFWTSDMTDALDRQSIQRWTGQLVAPEYLGAHVSAPTSHQTGRTFDLTFRAVTALFCAFGIEWDLTSASDDDRAELARWVEVHKRFRDLLHGGRSVRLDLPDPATWAYGVVAPDASEALFAYVQRTSPAHNRGSRLLLPGLDPAATYRLSWAVDPGDHSTSRQPPLDQAGPTRGVPVTGAALATTGVHLPTRRPETAALLHVVRV